MATSLWTPESYGAYEDVLQERAKAYHFGEYVLAIERAVDASEIASANNDQLRNAINVRDAAFAWQRLGDFSQAWINSHVAIDLTRPYENQEEYPSYVNFVPVLYPRREQAANHLARLRIALHVINSGGEINGFYEANEKDILIEVADDSFERFRELLKNEYGEIDDQYWVNAQQDKMLLERMHGRLGIGTYLACLRTVALTESRFTSHGPELELFSPKRLETVARQAGKVTQNLFARRP